MTNHYVCILGGTGFVGQHLAVRLNRMKIANKILTRQSQQHRELLVLPYSKLVEVDVSNVDCLSAEFESCTTVINLIGILNESGHDGTGFRQIHFNLTRKILQAAQQAGVEQLLHMSALNADASKGTSYYLRSKGEAEDYLHTFHGGMRLTTFRPSVIFGPGDSFFNRFAQLLKMSPGIFPLACAKTRFAPVYIGDVIDQFVQALNDRSMDNQRLNLCGPETYTLRELVDYTAKTLEINRIIIDLPDFLAYTQALLMEYLVPIRLFSLDNYHSLKTDSTCNQENCMTTDIRSIVPYYLGCSDQRSYYQTFRQNANRFENTAVRHDTDSIQES